MTLTKDLIETTPVGRELDALVAEYVLGWKRYELVPSPVIDLPNSGSKTLNSFLLPPSKELTPLPAFSTDIASAWLVVGHLKSQGRCIQILSDNADTWNVKILDVGQDSDRFLSPYPCRNEVDAPTAPEAICRAALLSVL